MSITQANCPTCGAQIVFRIGSSIVVICPSCNSAIARTDRNLADLGKVAALVETNSPLQIGLTGRYKNVPFELTGRAQLKHRLGGVWDEWYAAFSDGRWGWLAEAQGQFFMTFEAPILGNPPEYANVNLGELVPNMPGKLVVSEKGTAQYGGATGEIPYKLTPGASYDYADLSGPQGQFGTLDFETDGTILYLGAQVALSDLGIVSKTAESGAGGGKRVGVAKLACPHCGGALELHAPDQAQRVACPYCGSLLDASNGVLSYLMTLKVGKYNPLIGLGSVAEFENQKFTLIGFVVRSCTIDGTKYFWREYLLYNETLGFRWLVHSDNHWTYVKSVAPGQVREESGQKAPAYYGGKKFSRFQDADAVVEYVLGEFYWKVGIGDRVKSADFINPPQMLSKEIEEVSSAPAPAMAEGNLNQRILDQLKAKRPAAASAGEINWSLGEYLEVETVKEKFKLAALPQPTTVGACEPFRHGSLLKPWGVFSLIAVVLWIIVQATNHRHEVLRRGFEFPALEKTDGTQTIFSEPFELKAGQNIGITASAPVDNSWVFVDGDIINEETGEVQTFEIPIEYYHGVEDGESWTEGAKEGETVLSALPAGRYTLRMEATWDKFSSPMGVNVAVEQGVTSVMNLVMLLFVLSILPGIFMVWQFLFYKRRWAESMYNPFESE